VLGDRRLAHAAVEDFTTWTETDVSAVVTVASGSVTVANADRSFDYVVYSDEGAGAIGDFIHQFTLNATECQDINSGCEAGAWSVGNAASENIGEQDTSDVGINVEINECGLSTPSTGGECVGANDYKLQARDFTDDDTDTSSDLNFSTDYFITVERSSTTFTVTICTTAHNCGTPVDTLTLTVPSTTFQYVQVAQGGAAGTPTGPEASYVVSDLDLEVTSTDSITITSHADDDKVQRNIATNSQSVTISGTYVDDTDPPTAIEWQFDGGGWSTLDADPAGGTFGGTVTVPAGNGTLEVRMADDTGIAGAVSNFGVGDIFMVVGHSNAYLPATNAQTYSGSLVSQFFRLDDAWTADASDPSGTGSAGGLDGSQWPLLANLIEAAESTPVFVLTTALPNTMLYCEPTEWTPGDAEYDGAVQQVADSGVDDILAVIVELGGTDAADCGPTAAQWNTAVDGFLTNIQAEGGALAGVPLFWVALGDSGLGATDTNINDIRNGTMEAWDDQADIHPGGLFYDLDVTTDGDGTHYRSDADIAVAANRVFNALSAVLYGGTQTHPAPTAFEHAADLLSVIITFDQDVTVADASATAWDVVDNTGNVDANISDISASGSQVTITFSTELVEPVTVTLGNGDDAQAGISATVPRGTGVDTLPARSFTAEETSLEAAEFTAEFTVDYEGAGATAFGDSLTLFFLLLGLVPALAATLFFGGWFIFRR
jgi:hypothetical protein